MASQRPFGPLDEPRLGTEDFRVLRDVVNAACGLELHVDQRAMVERRLRDRLGVLGLDSFGEYVRFLRSDPGAKGELEEAIEALTTNETYFWREEYQLRAFRDEVAPMLVRQANGRKRLVIWSAGCSTGEEVYTLATILLDLPDLDGWDLLVYGSDISKRCLAHARRAIYGPSAFRAAPPDFRKRWFIERREGAQVADRVRQICHFGHLNLLEHERAPAVGRVDAIFCRNVLIYLDPRARRRVIDLFHERLYPGGVLFLGHSESLLNVSTAFELLHLRDDLAYRRPLMSGFGYASPRAMRAASPVSPDDAPPSSSSAPFAAKSEGRLVRATPIAPSSSSGGGKKRGA